MSLLFVVFLSVCLCFAAYVFQYVHVSCHHARVLVDGTSVEVGGLFFFCSRT